MTEPSGGPSFWARLWQRPGSRWLLGIPIGGFIAVGAGALGLVAFVGAVEMSSTETFCISCHEMRDNVYEEYKETIHYSNRTGVRATCPDCHVPKSWGPKLMRKVGATFKELPNHFLGKINTPAKFAAHRAELAEHVWQTMKGNDSRECRNCHELEHMDLDAQSKSARRKHDAERLAKKGETCIDCHQGIAHTLPPLVEEPVAASAEAISESPVRSE